MGLNLEAATQRINARIQEEAEKTAKEMATRADYKIQIWFRSERSMKKPIAYTLSFWESGKRLHGGGDEMMFICRRHEHAPQLSAWEVDAAKLKSPRGCDGLIPGGIGGNTGLLVCPHCHARHKPDQVGDSIFYRTTVNQAADVLAKWWRKLGGKADLYAKYNPTDPRSIMMAQNYDYRTAREKKGLTIYPLQNILKDTLAGATLESRFKAFITA
jgi:hypothetical protein